jgi:hypothetical protein
MPAPVAWLEAPSTAWPVVANRGVPSGRTGGAAYDDQIDQGVLWSRNLEEGRLDLGMERSIHAVPGG